MFGLSFLSTSAIGAALAVAVLGAALGYGDHLGAARIQHQWDQAKIVEAKRESDLVTKANTAELMLNAATSTLNDTADQLEKAREDALAQAPAATPVSTPVATACVDSPADVDGLRRLIVGK